MVMVLVVIGGAEIIVDRIDCGHSIAFKAMGARVAASDRINAAPSRAVEPGGNGLLPW